jgi:hypothetical protein
LASFVDCIRVVDAGARIEPADAGDLKAEFEVHSSSFTAAEEL